MSCTVHNANSTTLVPVSTLQQHETHAGGRKKCVPAPHARPLLQFSVVLPRAVAAGVAPVCARAAGAPLGSMQPRSVHMRPVLRPHPSPVWYGPFCLLLSV